MEAYQLDTKLSFVNNSVLSLCVCVCVCVCGVWCVCIALSFVYLRVYIGLYVLPLQR